MMISKIIGRHNHEMIKKWIRWKYRRGDDLEPNLNFDNDDWRPGDDIELLSLEEIYKRAGKEPK